MIYLVFNMEAQWDGPRLAYFNTDPYPQTLSIKVFGPRFKLFQLATPKGQTVHKASV